MKHTLIAAALVAAANAGVLKRDLTVQTISGWNSMGCYSDVTSDHANRTLNHLVGVGNDVSGTECQAKCQQLGYLYAGNEFGGQCYCDNAINGAVQEPDTECNSTCPGDPSQPCGQANRVNVYYNGPVQNYKVPGWNSYACITDSVYARALRYRQNADNMTPQVCASACSAAGYNLFGVEYSGECYCDNYIQNSHGPTDPSTCNMACSGDSSLVCGGAGTMNLFSAAGTAPSAQPPSNHDLNLPSGWTYSGCYTDSVGSRALNSSYPGPPTGMTIEYCINTCNSKGFSYGGLEFGDECYCGNAIENGQVPASDGCDMACSGDNSELCGSGGRISLYMQEQAQWNQQGCFDGFVGGYEVGYTTLDSCKSACSARGYDVLGVAGSTCSCAFQEDLDYEDLSVGNDCCVGANCPVSSGSMLWELDYSRYLLRLAA